jgi:predicted metalloprotease with PDZ domain
MTTRAPFFQGLITPAILAGAIFCLGTMAVNASPDKPRAAAAISPAGWRQIAGSSLGRRFADSGDFEATTRKFKGGEIRIALSSGGLQGKKPELLDWVDRAASAVINYYGKFPVTQLTLVVVVDDGDAIHAGNERGGKLITIKMGARTRASDFDDDWHLTHEFFHLGFPDVPDEYHWMEEGLSTYLEPLARARVGQLSAERIWKDVVEGMPQGLPKKGDRGLDHTPTWGRTYWGGALFWLMADVEIRERTGNRRSLDDAIRAIWSQGGDGSADWSVARVLREGDRATGLSVLTDLHAQMGDKPVDVDLSALWKRLGVIYQNRRVTFDDRAPLAFVRTALTKRLDSDASVANHQAVATEY